jgi:hypothetical protein
MSSKANQEKVEGRFDKVLSYYWDGIPAPLLSDTEKVSSQTFVCRQLAFTPDYNGETVSVSLVEPVQATLFTSLSSQTVGPQPASCRIGSHYSFYVGLFRFTEDKHLNKKTGANGKVSVRVPVEYCENDEECNGEVFAAHCRVRTEKFVALYKPLIKEHLPLSRNSLRNMIILSSKGCTSVSREIIAREISDVNEEYANALSEAVFYYMALNPLQRRILKPLQLATEPEIPSRSIQEQFYSGKSVSQQRFNDARQELKKQLFWNSSTRGYFAALQALWDSKFSHLSLLSTDAFSNTVEVATFIGQMSGSINSVISRIRIEFYANVEDFFFSLIPTANDVLLISESDYENSALRRIFVATEVFFVNKMRNLVFDGLDNLVAFFDCDGCGSITRLSRCARLCSFIRLDLLVAESFQPRAPGLALLLFGIRDLFDQVETGVNSLPSIGCVVLRTLNLEPKKMNIVSRVEMASYRATLAEMLNEVALIIDSILSTYKVFCTIPVQNLTAARTTSEVEMTRHVNFARQQLVEIYRGSRQQFYCGRFQISCAALQDTLAREWENYVSTLTSEYQKTILSVVENAKARSNSILKVFDTTPSNVEEMEAHLQNTEAAKSLAQELRNSDCKKIFTKVSCMEELFISIQQDVCSAVFEFMKLPDQLLKGADKASDVRARCAPLLRRRLNQLRTSTREYMQTLSTGVTELYHLFSLETCDIAAQTCAELRELVDRIDTNLKKITHEEEVLGIPIEDTFESFPSLLHHFEVIEQFWNTIFDATKLRNMYNSPISSVNASASVEKVREWRRLIHSSARHLRGFPVLMQLGREQEVALVKYEELGLFLEVISSPNLRKHHWKDIAKLIAAQLREDVASVVDMSVTVKRLLDAGLMEHMGPLGQITNQAQCDYEVESALEEMRSYGKRTHFVFDDSDDGGGATTSVAHQFIAEAAGHVEQFVIRCRTMHRYPNVGQLMQKSLLEWEFSCEKSREMLAAFECIQEHCAWVENCLRTLQMTRNGKINTNSNRDAVIRHLSSASEAIKRLHTTLRKPQFSLYTAMAQDTIQEFFFAVKTAVDDAQELLHQTLEQRQAAFPRFRFLSDTQLVKLQFILLPKSFVPLLSCLYTQLAGVETVDDDVAAVVAVDGASLPLLNRMPLAAASPDAWLMQLDRMIRRSLLAAVKSCVAAYYCSDLESWVSAWCGQVVVLALRILHTEAIRHALQIGGVEALQAYANKVSDVCCALGQLALESNEATTINATSERESSSGTRGEATIRAALAYEQFALREVQLAIEWGVCSVADLDSTQLLQTSFTPSGDGIRVSFMGVYINHGLEFLGHGRTLFMDSSQWKQVVMVLADMELGRSVPLICGESDVEVSDDVLRCAAQVLGRFYVRVELTSQTVAEALACVLRGCIEAGAFLCLANCETVSPTVLSGCVLPLVHAYKASVQRGTWELPYGSKGTAVSVPVHPLFRMALSSHSPTGFSLALSTLCETVRVAPPNVAECIHNFLTQAGAISLAPLSVEELELAELYEQLQERAPHIFTIKQLRVILRDLIANADEATQNKRSFGLKWPSPSLSQRFLKSLMHTSSGAFEGDDGTALRESLAKQMKAKLLLPSCKDAALQEWFAGATHDEAQITCDEESRRFAALIELHCRVLILGPRFSGKSELWKRWAGKTPLLVLSPQLITASDFYGNASQQGFLAQMVSQVTLTKAAARDPPVVVLEGVDAPSSFQLFAHAWFDGTRIPEGATSGTCVVASPKLRVIATAVEVHHITPGVVDGFAMMVLTGGPCWRETVGWALNAIPEKEFAQKVLEVLLPLLVDRAAKISPNIVGSASELTNMCAIAQRAASLCSRWYTYALNIRTHSDVLAPRDDDDEVDLRLFAARCAVMAASWSVGLALPSEDRDAVKLTLLSAEADVMKALAGCDLCGEVFPELAYNSIGPLEQVVLPQGWMSLEDAGKRTDLPLSWSGYRNMNPQIQASLQVFAMPSRVATLRSMECLMNCGQHVLFHAGGVSGKTTLLHTMRTCENWVAQVFQMNAGFHATGMQQTMARVLSKRSDGCYGPPLGRRLVVCIDDLHLSPGTAGYNSIPIAGSLMSYCEKFRVISTPALGTVPVTDVVFCSSTGLRALLREGGSVGAASGCVDVLLPSFEGDEIASGLLQMCDMASSRKRAKGFPQECATFLELAHGAYCQLKQRAGSLANLAASATVGFPAQGFEDGRLDALPSTTSANRTPSTNPDATTGLRKSSPFFSAEHLRELLEAAEVVRLHLLSTVSDFQVSARVFIGVTTFYDERLYPPPHPLSADTAAPSSLQATQERNARQILHEFRNAVVEAAEGTLRNSVRGSIEFRDLAQELPEEFSHDVVSVEDESHVAQRIAFFQGALAEEEETDLSELAERRKANTVERHHHGGSTIRSETRHVSVLLSYPDSFKTAAVRAEGPNKEVYVRRLSTAVTASTRSSRQQSSASSVTSELSSVAQQRLLSSKATPTYQTTWLTTRFTHLANTLSVPGSHLLLLGDNTFGMRRLYRLWCASSHIPFMWFRVNAADTPKDIISTFVKELRATLTYVCQNSVHAVAYLPPPLLRMPEVLRIMDAIVRSGDVSTVFSDDEGLALLNGSNATHSRSLRPFILADDSELRNRVRGCMNFVFHLRDATEARQLGEGYPFLRPPDTISLPLYTEELEKSLLEEIALGILHSTDAYGGGIRKLEDEDDTDDADAADEERETSGDDDGYGKRLSPLAACTALCAMFACVRRTHPTTVEQFMEFVRLYKELDGTARVQVLESARTGKVIAGRGDAAVQAVTAATQRSREIVEALAAMETKVTLLNEKLAAQERQHAVCVAEVEEAQKALLKEKSSIQKEQDTVAKCLGDAKEDVAKALKQLSKVKSGVVRALSMSRVPDKGPLLVRAVYAVLGEDVPKHNDNASELWTLSMKRMCTKEFIGELAARAPDSGTSFLPVLLPFRREIDTVRYAPALPYAQLLADFVVAWVDCARFLAEDYTVREAEIVKAKQQYELHEASYQAKQQEVVLAETAAAKTRTEVENQCKLLAALQQEQNDLSGGEGRLLKYTGLVDRFTRFLAGSASVSERVKRAQCATGDTLLVAAYYTLLAMHKDAASMSAKLQEVLTSTMRGTALRFSPFEEVCAQLLYQTHAPRTEALTAVGCSIPWEYKALLLSLYQRRASRWTLVGGGGPVVAHELLRFLSLCCTGSVTVSAADPLVKERLAAAMRSGEGVLLRDVHSAASLDLVRSLNPLYQRLKQHHASLHRKQWFLRDAASGATLSSQINTSKKQAALQPKEEAAQALISVWFDGQEVRVHPQFFLVCTCFSVVTSGLQEACERLDVFNLHRSLSRDARLEWLLYSVVKSPSVSTKIASMQDEVQTRQQVYLEVLQDFMEAHDSAAAVLATDLRDVCSNQRGDALLAEMEKTLAQVDTYDAQMAQTASYVQSLQRMVQEGWDTILPAMKAVARATELIETVRLGRPWHASGLESCVTGISELSPALIRRIAPLSFSDLPIGQKCYYALVQYLQRVVDLLGPGWPPSLKGLFSLSILCTAISAAPAAFATECKVHMLTNGQRRVLACLMYDNAVCYTAETTHLMGTRRKQTQPSRLGEVAANAREGEQEKEEGGKEGEELESLASAVRQLYATSDDALLRRLSCVVDDTPDEGAEKGFNIGGETSYEISQLFTALLELDAGRASGYAGTLFNTFMSSVTVLHTGADHPPARLATRENAGGRSPSKAVGQAHASSTTEIEFDGGASSKHAGSEMSDISGFQAEVPTVDAQIQRAVSAHLPLCLVSESHVEDTLMWLQGEVKETKWVFQWHDLLLPSPTPSMFHAEESDTAGSLRSRASLLQAFEEATHLVVSLAQAPCAPEACGMCLTLVVDAKVDASSNADTAVAADLLLFQEQWHRLLMLYTTMSSIRASSGTAPTLCLAVVCSVAVQQMIWGKLLEGNSTSQFVSPTTCSTETAPCCFFALSTCTAQFALVNLLQPSRRFFTKDGALQVCASIIEKVEEELASRAGPSTPSEKLTTRIRGPALAKQNFSRGATQLSVPLPELPPFLSTGALTALRRAASELHSCVLLLQYEMIVAYVASTGRLHFLYRTKKLVRSTAESALLSHIAERKRWRHHIYSTAPLSRLHALLSAWVRQQYGELVAQLGGSPGTGKPQMSVKDAKLIPVSAAGMKTTPAQVRSLSSQPLPIRVPAHRSPTAEHLGGHGAQAYYFLRRHQPTWGLLLQKAERLFAEAANAAWPLSNTEGTVNVLDPVLCSVMRAPDVLATDDENTDPVSRAPAASSGKSAANSLQRAHQHQQEFQIEDAGQHWKTGLFVMARKFALHYLCARDARSCVSVRDSTLSLMEQREQWDMLRTFIGAADDTEEVSFLWGSLARGSYADLKKWHALRIDVCHLEAFRADVAGAPSDLMELCGETGVIERFREMHRRYLLQLCFSQAVCGDAEDSLEDSAGANAPAHTAEGQPMHTTDNTQQEARLALFVLQDALVDANRALISTATTAVKSLLEWEAASLDTCAAHPKALNRNFQNMVESFTFAIAPERVKTGEIPSGPFNPQLVHLWLPALQHPLFDLHFLTGKALGGQPSVLASNGAPLSPQMHCTRRSCDDPFANMPLANIKGNFFATARTCGAMATALVLVVTQQRFLSASDVVLSGARISSSLLRQILALTGWERGGAKRGCDIRADSARDVDTEEGIVIAVRRVLIRLRKEKGDGDVARDGGNVEAVPNENGDGRQIAVEVGMHVRWADPLSPGLTWCKTVCVQAAAEGALWDTRPTCRSQYTDPSSQSLSTAHSDSPSHASHRASDNFFVTAVGREGEFINTQITGFASARHSWSFTDVPVPVRWSSVHGAAEPGVVEFPLCVEFDQLSQDRLTPRAVPSTDAPSRKAERVSAADDDMVAGSVFSVQEALDAYLWIA